MPVAIRGRNISFSYDGVIPILSSINMDIQTGQWTAILGANGSGKSTFVLLCNALLPLDQGTLSILGMDVKDKRNHPILRRTVGMLFQNPKEQIIEPLVRDDIAFGLRNYHIPEEIIPQKTEKALKLVGMEAFADRTMTSLSGGQLQKITLAGVLALEPRILILDEATSMLDPSGRDDLMQILHRFRQEGTTIITVTQQVDESVDADQIIVLGNGTIKAQGTPETVLRQTSLLRENGLIPPLPVRLWEALGQPSASAPITNESFVEAVCGWN